MTISLSPIKISKILRHYFSGYSQVDIALKAGVDQSSISNYASRFRKRVEEIGLPEAGKEFGVFNEVEALRSLSVELHQAKLSSEDAAEGVHIINTFIKLGVSRDQHSMLVKVCKQIGDPGFVPGAIKLCKIQAETQMSYEEAILKYEKTTAELNSLEKQRDAKQSEVNNLNKLATEKKQEISVLDSVLIKKQDEYSIAKKKSEQELAMCMKNLNVKKQEVEEVAALKAEAQKKGLDITTLMKLAKEFKYGNTKS